ncbi:MAG: hydroxymethylbilane synthase [Proteobacteria bacterium]|nr:hydroxymethylbilane synthase [Pseudomonadota bacterium]MBU4295905.1 hydroxymethylbilane synthase [Pseudomonadota bacterium]MCG2749101.1 hydroxymethylbilane synthase [Desulfobulbaceae bacterium]
MQKTIKIGTRASLLALAQSTNIKNLIEAQYPEVKVELVKIVTTGDKILDVPLAKVGGKGLFVKEIEDAMLQHEVDIAVHSMKDVPAELPEELHLGIITKREDPRDAFIANDYKTFADLPQGARVGTSSLRRKSQIGLMRSDLVISDLRGNLDTRLRKLDEKQFDAIILATAGLNRLKLSHRIASHIDPADMLPAVGQGAVGIELRKADTELLASLTFLADETTAVAVRAERSFLHRLEGGCQVPIGAFAELEGSQLTITGLVASVDGSKMIKKQMTGDAADAANLGTKLAEEILADGGGMILAEVYGKEID